MGRPKKQLKLKEPVKIRLKPISDGNRSIYLDIYWKGMRKYEYLKLYLVPEVNPLSKEENRETMAVAEQIKAERIKALNGHSLQDWDTVRQSAMLLSTWIKKYCEGGVGVKKSTLHCRKEMMNTIEKYLAEKELDLTATLDAEMAYRNSEIVVIAAPTNYDSKTQHFDTSAVENLIGQVLTMNPAGGYQTSQGGIKVKTSVLTL